jgi:hypothetical protein
MNSDQAAFFLSDNEFVVRDYACTMLTKFLSPPTIGYLTVTNKRIVYHCQGHSLSGTSKILSEMPLDDVAGISSMVGASINWLFLIVMLFVLHFGSTFLLGFFPPALTGWVITILLLLPYSVGWLFEKNILNKEIQDQMRQNLAGSTAGGILLKRDRTFYMGIFEVLFAVGTVLAANNLIDLLELGSTPLLAYLLLFGSYFYVYMIFFGRKRIFSLMISSKTGKAGGIYIPGNAFSLIWGRNNTALQSLSAGPAGEAENIVRELGALLTDIRLMGDLGIQKWTRSRSTQPS